MFTDDFDDGTSIGWTGASSWHVVESEPGDRDYEGSGPGLMTVAGLIAWENYDVSVDLESISNGDEAGIVFYLTLSPLNYYYFGVDHNPEIPGNPDAGTCKIWKYVNGTRDASPLAEADISIGYPMHLRMTRQDDGSFLCWANGTQLIFSEASPYTGGFVGLRVETGTATFDNVAIHGQNAFLMDDGSHEILFEDPMNRLDLDGTPYTWCLLGNWVLGAVGGDGKYLRGTYLHDLQNPVSPEAWPGEEGWTDYHVLADVRLDTDNAEANVYFRHSYTQYPEDSHSPSYHGFQYYTCVLSYNAALSRGELRLWKRWLKTWPAPPEWMNSPLGPSVPIQGFNRQLWHLVEVDVENVAGSPVVKCYLNNDGDDDPLITYTDTGTTYGYVHGNGRVGLAVGKRQGSPDGNQTASFDNVIVLEE